MHFNNLITIKRVDMQLVSNHIIIESDSDQERWKGENCH